MTGQMPSDSASRRATVMGTYIDGIPADIFGVVYASQTAANQDFLDAASFAAGTWTSGGLAFGTAANATAAITAADPWPGDGCATAEVAMDGVTGEDTVTVDLDSASASSASDVHRVVYTIGDVSDDTSPWSSFNPGAFGWAGDVLTRVKFSGRGPAMDSTFKLMTGSAGDAPNTYAAHTSGIVFDTWETINLRLSEDTAFFPAVDTISGNEGPVTVYFEIESHASGARTGDKIRVKKHGRRGGGHGRWRKD